MSTLYKRPTAIHPHHLPPLKLTGEQTNMKVWKWWRTGLTCQSFTNFSHQRPHRLWSERSDSARTLITMKNVPKLRSSSKQCDSRHLWSFERLAALRTVIRGLTPLHIGFYVVFTFRLIYLLDILYIFTPVKKLQVTVGVMDTHFYKIKNYE